MEVRRIVSTQDCIEAFGNIDPTITYVPNVALNDLIGVEPMSGPPGLVRMLHERYGESKTEDFIFPKIGTGRGSRVEKLPAGDSKFVVNDDKMLAIMFAAVLRKRYDRAMKVVNG